MAAHVLRLRIALLLGAFRGDPRHRLRTTAALAAVLLAVVAVCAGVGRLPGLDPALAQALVVIGGSVVVAGFAAAPLVTGTDDVLDPRRFAVLGASPRPLAGALAAASLVGVSAAALVAVAVALVSSWVARGIAPVVAVVWAVVGVVTCLLATRVAQAIGTLALRPRRSRELTALLAAAALAAVVPAALFLAAQPWGDGVPADVEGLSGVLSVTPLGAAWSVPGSAAPAWPIAVALATPVALAAAWAWLVRRLLSTVDPPAPPAARGRLGWFAVTAGTPTGAVAARSLHYWLRDSRYLANLLMVPVAAALAALPLLPVGLGLPSAALLATALAALLFGWLAHDDVAYDASALWMHVAAGVPGHADRIGRLVPVVTVAVPLLAVAVPLAVAADGSWEILPAVVGACASLFLSGLGLSSVTSVALPYVVSSPGDGPFQQPQRSHGGMGPAVVLFGALLLSAPALWLAGRTLVAGDDAMPAFWAGVVTGVVVLVAGVVVGSIVYSHRQGALMELAESMS